MALNTIHKDKKDLVSFLNVTQGTKRKAELVSKKQSERVRASLGLDLPSVKLTLKVNGYDNTKERDKIQVLNETFIVSKISTNFSMNLQFRKRADYEYFNGESYLFLE